MSFGGWVIVITGLVLFGETSSLSHPGHNLIFLFQMLDLDGVDTRLTISLRKLISHQEIASDFT